MPAYAYVCKVCGDDVWAETGHEIRTSIQHSKDAGHTAGGLCVPDSAHARQLRAHHPVSGFTARQAAPSPRARRWWDALPLQLRALAFLITVGLAIVASSALSDALDDTPSFINCHERIAC
ncbi:hypothetical protein ACIP79_38700 [Streptomyces sp. NPDC088747]|uniref:hypothetical protein n=1 Tax=Streptomyces sp. NPDC088747 TaxID=3365886 RepID=UPI0038171541